MSTRAPEPQHIVILVHGIRTHALWYERAKDLFGLDPRFKVYPVKYGRFDLFRFLIPGPWRAGPVKKTKDTVLPLVVEARRRGQKITVISHSNGTQIVASILQSESLFRIDNLIMCGSVVDTNYRWDLVRDRVPGWIVNDYGVRDVWPAVARSLTWGYDYSGTVGFGAPVEDRMHDCGHSAYFTAQFMTDYWLPLIADDRLVPSPLAGRQDAKHPWWFALLEFPWKWMLAAALVAAAALLAAYALRRPDSPVASPAAPGGGSGVTAPRGNGPSSSSAYDVVQSSFSKTGEAWRHFDIYRGAPRNPFREDSPLQTFGFGEDEDLGEYDTLGSSEIEHAADAPRTPVSRIAATMARYGLSLSHPRDRARLATCLASPTALPSCPAPVQAAVLDLAELGNLAELDGLLEFPGDFAESSRGLAAAPPNGGAAPAGSLPRMRLVIRNRSGQDRIVTAFRFTVRELYPLEGDGVVTDQPQPIRAVPAGTLRLRDLFIIDCNRPDVRPNAAFVLAEPVPVRANGVRNFEIRVDMSMYHRLADDVTLFPSESIYGHSAARQCAQERANRRAALAAHPAFANALRMVQGPLFSDHQSSVVEIAVQDDTGRWHPLGLMNFMLP